MADERARFQFVTRGRFSGAKKLVAGLVGLFLFILALQLLKAAASGLAGLVAGLGADTPWGALGFGWIFAYVVLSGSPVAAVALSFYAGGVIDDLSTFAMIAGSRFGAAYVVLLLGFLYFLRGRASRGNSLEMGVLSLLTTYAVYGIAIPLGALILVSGALSGFDPGLPAGFFDLIAIVYDPIVHWLDAALPRLVLFGLGIGTVLVAFNAFDLALPDLAEESPIRGLEAHVYRPSVMFVLGCVITLFTLSVSVSLGLLVPLSAKGIARRENVIPYIMGANITTFVDTLLATLLLGTPGAFTIVLVEMLSVAGVSLVLLAVVYARFERGLLTLSRLVLRNRVTLTLFVLIILLVPVLLLVL